MNSKNLITFLITATTILGMASAASAATFCQEKGHGASGCTLADGSSGYCWSNNQSPTGYVCKEDKPSENGRPTTTKTTKAQTEGKTSAE